MGIQLMLCVERSDGSTFHQVVNLVDIDWKYIQINEDGTVFLNLRALSLELFGSGYKICSARFC